MKTCLTWLLFAVIVSSVSTAKGVCVDQYGHCKEWSKAGFCNTKGYQTYMTVMCAYSCNVCQDRKEVTRSSGVEDADESGSSVDQQAEDVSSTTEQQINEAVNPIAGDTAGDSKPQHTDNQHSTDNDPSHGKEYPRIVEGDGRSDEGQQSEVATNTAQKTIETGIREVVAPQALDDEVDPRSKIVAPPVKKLHQIVKKLKKTITETTSYNREEVISGEDQPDEIRDVAGDVTSGSKIFEDSNFGPESTSGCASGYGCFSELGEQVKESQAEETQQLESRSKIDRPESNKPVISHLESSQKERTVDSHGEDADGEAKKVNDVSIKETDVPKDIDHEQHTNHRGKTIDVSSGSGVMSSSVSLSDKQVSGSGDGSSVTPARTNVPQPVSTIDPKPVVENDGTAIDDSHSGSGDHTITLKKQPKETNDKNTQESQMDRMSEGTSENTVSGSGTASGTISENQPDSIERISQEDLEENINGIQKTDKDIQDIDKELDAIEDNAPGSSKVSIDETQNDEAEKVTSKGEALYTQTKDTAQSSSSGQQGQMDEDNIEDALFEKGAVKTTKLLPTMTETKKKATQDTVAGKTKETMEKVKNVKAQSKELATSVTKAEKQEKGTQDTVADKTKETTKMIKETTAESKQLTSPKNKERLISMEELINNGKLKPQKVIEVQANTREEVPSEKEVEAEDERQAEEDREAEEERKAEQQFIVNKIGKSHRVSLVLDQHYYKPYSNEDSMAYEMLALDFKKEVERVIGNDALVSQITFSESKQPGRLPSYSHVLVTFTLNGDETKLHDAVKTGAVGGMMVVKHFFQTS